VRLIEHGNSFKSTEITYLGVYLPEGYQQVSGPKDGLVQSYGIIKGVLVSPQFPALTSSLFFVSSNN
jgi:hypothetical protein